MTANDWQMFLAWMPIAPEDLVLVLGADFISGDDGRLVLALPRWHRQALSTESEERLLMMLAAMSELPYAEPRCFDEMCQCKQGCRRYLDRHDAAIRYCSILRPLWQCHDFPCAHHIPTEDPDA